MQTRIKICGLTRPEDVDAAVDAGADAVGFVFYPPSPRYVSPVQAVTLVRRLPPFVLAVGLFVNETEAHINQVLDQVPLNLLQFHGEETPFECARWNRPYLRAARVQPGLDLVQYAAVYSSARAILLDAFVEGYGGGGKTFDWSLIPPALASAIVLSGGLDPENVAEAVARIRPAAVDVSSGVEVTKGVKDAAKMRAFVAAVRSAELN